MAPSLLLGLLGLLSSAASLPPPRTSFLLHSADRPLVLFSLPDVRNTTTLLLSDDGSTLYVGAQNTILSLDVSQSDVINLKEKVQWSPSASEINQCQQKGKDPAVDCPNFVRVLQPINSTHLYACGSFAYSPRDAYIDTGSFSIIQHSSAKVKVRCPFNPFHRNIATTIDGELFTATTTDFRGVKPEISRHFSKDGRPDVCQDSSVSLLEEPTFVSSSSDPSDGKLYFFFSEIGKEFSFVDELQIARVAQVCKDDVGGIRTLQKKWTSFAKAPLVCQSPKQLPFNVLQDMFTLQPPGGNDTADTLFYGVFTSQWSLGPESAVCVFRLQDIRDVFSQSYKTLDMQTDLWSLRTGKHNMGKCGLGNASDSVLADVKRSFLTSSSVKPAGGRPIVVASGQQYSRVAAMRTQAANGKQYTVLFLLTESGFLHKVVLFDGGAHIIEEIQVFTQPQLVKSIVLSSAKGVFYVGTSEGVTAVPVAKCSTYRTCSQCLLARDPLCGWSRTTRVCTGLHDGSHKDVAQDLEGGNVEEKCRGQTKVAAEKDVFVYLNKAVRLLCQKPSQLASLTWTSLQSRNPPQEFFVQSADGSLSFVATAATLGTYHCEAEEGGYKEVIASYRVQQIASPRSISPLPQNDNHPFPSLEVESVVDVMEPVASTIQPSKDNDDYTMKDNNETPGLKNDDVVNPTSRKDPHLGNEPASVPQKDYYSELVVVSLLLVTCICVLIFGALCMWHQRKTGLKMNPLVSPDGSKTNQSMESVPSLSSPDPEVKVME